MPTEIRRLLGYDGPNLHGPQPGVFLQVYSNKDRGRRIKSALKDGGQSAGLVLGYFDIRSAQAGDGYLISAGFSTPTPALGVELARYVVEGLNAREAGDEAWDDEGPLWELQKRRQAEALPIAVLQVVAEAGTRGVPATVRSDGLVQLGYGVRSWVFDPAQAGGRAAESELGPPPFARSALALDVPWERLGPIPIMALTGGAARETASRLVAATLFAQQPATRLAEAADFAATQALLADQGAALAVAGLTPDGIARRGLAFERCAYSAVTDLPDTLPAEVQDQGELARVLGVPMLVTDPQGWVALNADVPEIVALAEYAPCEIIYISTAPENATIGFHRAGGGAALFVRDGVVVAASGAGEQAVAAATLAPNELPGALAALGLLWKMGLTWEQIVSSPL